MPRQVSDEEFAYLQGRRQVADFVESIYNDPQLNREAKALIKKKYPNLQIPDYDLENKVAKVIVADRQERRKEKEAELQKAEDAKIKEDRDGVQKQYGFTEDAMKDLEDFMVKNHVGSYEVAASYKAAKDPKVSSNDDQSRFWHFNKKEEFKKIIDEPEDWARQELIKAARADEQRMKNGR
jgi:hypothetical protein